MVNMRLPMEPDDLSTRAKIRHAAMLRFALEGFGANLRTIGQDVGVSAATVVKIFGSKVELRAACDAYVYETMASSKFEILADKEGLGGGIVGQFARMPEFRPLVVYLVRVYQEGGEGARALLDRMVTDAVAYQREGVEEGRLVPSRDDELRARFLIGSMMGNLLFELHHADGDEALTSDAFWERALHRFSLPAFEMYTEGLLTDRTLLDTYLLYMSDPPMDDARRAE